MPLRGTIESVYKGTLVYAREHNPTLVSYTTTMEVVWAHLNVPSCHSLSSSIHFAIEQTHILKYEQEFPIFILGLLLRCWNELRMNLLNQHLR